MKLAIPVLISSRSQNLPKAFMHQPTSALSLAGPRRSSWFLRLLFATLGIALVASILTASTLVGYTVTRYLFGPNESFAPLGNSPVADIIPFERVGSPQTDEEGGLHDSGVDVWDKHGPINILLLGLDIDDCEQSDGYARRTDTMIVVRVDPDSKTASMMSIPRDLYVYVSAYWSGEPVGAKKINMSHLYGTEFEVDEEGIPHEIPHTGPNVVKATIRDNLGIPIHRYVRVDVEGFQDIVDALDGVRIDVPASEDDPTIGLFDTEYPDDKCGVKTISFPPGEQTLNGEEALQYARSRKSTSDFDRSRRQMDVLMAMREKGTRPGVILDLPKLVPAVMDTVDTDFTADEIFALARVGRNMDRSDIVRLQMDSNVVYDDLLVIDNVPQWVLRIDQSAFDALYSMFLNPRLAIQATQDAAELESAPADAPDSDGASADQDS